MKRKTVIKLDNVWKTYRMGEVDVHALRGLDFEVHEGEFVAIMGPSGSGKSTAVNMIGCLDVPSKGKVVLDSYDISKLSESRLALIRGKTIGFIFQQFNLIPTLTALENVTLPMIFQGYSEDERDSRGRKLLEMVQLGERYHHKPTEMSGGQQQRVAIARSLSNDPEVLIADEPTGNLDSETGKKVLDFLIDLNTNQGKTIIMVTHDPHVSEIAGRTVYLKDGKIVKEKKRKRRAA